MANKKPVEFYKQTQVLEKQTVKKTETDDVLSGNDKLMFLISQYWKQLAIGLGAIAAVIVILVIIMQVREQKDLELRCRFSDAKEIETLAALIADHADHPTALGARFRLAGMKAADGDYAGAADTLQEIADLPEIDIYHAASAELRAASYLEQGNEDAKARVIYIALMQNPEADQIMRSEARYGAVRLSIKLGINEDVAEYLKEVKDETSLEMNYWDIQLVNLKKRLAMEKVKFVAPAAPAVPAVPAVPAPPAK